MSDALAALETGHARRFEADGYRSFISPASFARAFEEEKALREERAAYDARVIAAYLPCWGRAPLGAGLLFRMVGLLDDRNSAVRETIRAGLEQLRWEGLAPPELPDRLSPH